MSCAFDSQDESIPGQKQEIKPVSNRPSIIDDDKDGLSNSLEDSLGRDNLKSTFPRFKVVDFKYTKLELIDFYNPSNFVLAEYKEDRTIESDLRYDPVADKLARHAYTRVVGQTERPAPVAITDLGVIKLSNFEYSDTQKIRNFLSKNRSNVDDQSSRITSRFSLEVEGVIGIIKINNLKGELGFIDVDGDFSSFGDVFDLFTVSNIRSTIFSKGYSATARTSMDILLYVDRLNIKELDHILDNDLQLALRIADYEITTLEGETFQFSKQSNESRSVGPLYALTVDQDTGLFISARTETIGDALGRYMGEVTTDNEGTVLSVNGMSDNTDRPIRFEENGNYHLKQNSWYLFSENDKTSDVPTIGNTVMAGFLQNKYVAQAGKRIISKAIVADSTNEFNYKIADLKIGESVKLELTGYEKIPVPLEPLVRSSESVVTRRDCTRVRDPGSFLINEPRPEKECFNYDERGWCGYYWRPLGFRQQEYDFVKENELHDIFFTSESLKRRISLKDKSFFRKNYPVKKIDSNSWIIEIRIDEAFLNEYGSYFVVKLPRKNRQEVVYGLAGFENCGHRSRGSNFRFLEPSIREHRTSGDSIHELNLRIERIFKF